MKLFGKKQKIDYSRLPNCVAFVIDGNGRWAKKRGLPRMLGHKAGIDVVKQTIQNCEDIGIKEVLFFCFSTENWNRPKPEVDGLFNLFREFMNTEAEKYYDKNIMFKMIGERTKVPSDIIKKVEVLEQKTANCTKMKVGLCINYGGRYDVVQAVNNIIKQGKTSVTEQEFKTFLLTKDFSEPDMVIRTSGEQRLSNFLLYQMAYSELYFTKTFWPDFSKQDLIEAICNFQTRNRRFGAIKE